MISHNFNGLTAFVTCAGEDVGRAVALRLAQAGANVAIHACDGEGSGGAVAQEVRELGVQSVHVTGDVTNPDDAASMIAQVRVQLGEIDLMVHCVGIRPHSLVAESTVDEWHDVIDTNCSSFFYLARHLIPTMTARKFGRLIAVGVALDDRTRVQHASVAAARAALRELVKVVAVETADAGITANIVSIAITETTKASLLEPKTLSALVPIPRPAKLDEIASACMYLASDKAGYVTGHTLHVDGGYTL
jgi:3-oxoacyl-[acyl-carrier protein] reductase